MATEDVNTDDGFVRLDPKTFQLSLTGGCYHSESKEEGPKKMESFASIADTVFTFDPQFVDFFYDPALCVFGFLGPLADAIWGMSATKKGQQPFYRFHRSVSGPKRLNSVVRRTVYKENGVEKRHVAIHLSLPWHFPNKKDRYKVPDQMGYGYLSPTCWNKILSDADIEDDGTVYYTVKMGGDQQKTIRSDHNHEDATKSWSPETCLVALCNIGRCRSCLLQSFQFPVHGGDVAYLTGMLAETDFRFLTEDWCYFFTERRPPGKYNHLGNTGNTRTSLPPVRKMCMTTWKEKKGTRDREEQERSGDETEEERQEVERESDNEEEEV